MRQGPSHHVPLQHGQRTKQIQIPLDASLATCLSKLSSNTTQLGWVSDCLSEGLNVWMYETKESTPVPHLGNCTTGHIVQFIYFYVKAQDKWISVLNQKAFPLKEDSWKSFSDVSFFINMSTSIKSTEAKKVPLISSKETQSLCLFWL